MIRDPQILIKWVQNGRFLGTQPLDLMVQKPRHVDFDHPDLKIRTWSNHDIQGLTTQNDWFSTPFLTPFFGVLRGSEYMVVPRAKGKSLSTGQCPIRAYSLDVYIPFHRFPPFPHPLDRPSKRVTKTCHFWGTDPGYLPSKSLFLDHFWTTLLGSQNGSKHDV